MKENNLEDKIFSSPLDLEEERRKLEASDILYRAIKYVIGYLKGYKIEKHDNLKSNPMWIFIKVYWKTEDIEKDIEDIEKEIREMAIEREEESLRDAEKCTYKIDDEGIQRGD